MNLTLMQVPVGAMVFTGVDPSGVVGAARSFTPAQWAVVLYLGLGCSVFAFVVPTWAIRPTPASGASPLMSAEPFSAVAIDISTAPAPSPCWRVPVRC